MGEELLDSDVHAVDLIQSFLLGRLVARFYFSDLAIERLTLFVQSLHDLVNLRLERREYFIFDLNGDASSLIIVSEHVSL